MASQGLKRIVAAGAVAIVLGGAVIGFVKAEPGPSGTENGDQHQGFNREAFQQRREQFLNTLAGKLGIPVDKLRQGIIDTRKELGGPGGPGGPRAGMRGFGLEAAAQALNFADTRQLFDALRGKSLAQLATEKGVSVDTVKNAIKTAMTTRIDNAVAANRLSADQANQAKAGLDQRLDNLMNRTFPAAGQGFWGPRGPRGAQNPGQ
jgi:hypothetical protein